MLNKVLEQKRKHFLVLLIVPLQLQQVYHDFDNEFLFRSYWWLHIIQCQGIKTFLVCLFMLGIYHRVLIYQVKFRYFLSLYNTNTFINLAFNEMRDEFLFRLLIELLVQKSRVEHFLYVQINLVFLSLELLWTLLQKLSLTFKHLFLWCLSLPFLIALC